MALLAALLLVIPLFSSAQTTGKTKSLKNVREYIEKKDMSRAVEILAEMYPRDLQNETDIARVAKWLSVFLFDETISHYEKALELALKGDPSTGEELKKALLKEPNNKILNQMSISLALDGQRLEDASAQIQGAQKKYPYFKIFSLYKYYLKPSKVRASLKQQEICQTQHFSDEEKDFCRAVFLREAAQLKLKLDKKSLMSALSIKYPEALFSLWEMTSQGEYLKQYLAKCNGLSDKEKRQLVLFPSACTRVIEVETLLKAQPAEE